MHFVVGLGRLVRGMLPVPEERKPIYFWPDGPLIVMLNEGVEGGQRRQLTRSDYI